ncbi:cytochrome aa3 quinol oxidase subunit II [Terrilactibacillus laevilacticus]|uniref:Quinol oxidase subunit 2 n=1 Tax=Terrilactibacillus laevilacticus TaxID=1380157 RepID=A0ABW5PLV5_9BACI|nr:cytochrome aa3 quinol oxidase subunit II [Terrilactibacillus laevilacticus]
MKKLAMKLIGACSLLLLFLTGCTNKIAVLNPQGPIARQQYHLIIWSVILTAFIFAVVLIIFIYVLVKFGRKNNHAGYDPNNHGNTKLEITWTLIPVIICILLAVPTVKTLFALDGPPKPAEGMSKKEAITINVTSADWKWIFRYPDEGIQTVNYVVIPEDTPVKFNLFAHSSMNSFWVPELGGQQYTMPDMPMKLWLQADHVGNYLGRSANFSGRGFAGMQFHVLSKTDADYKAWIQNIKDTKPALTMSKYEDLLKPSNVKTSAFSSYPKELDKKDNKAMKKMNHMEHMDIPENHMDLKSQDNDMDGMDMSDDSTKGGK